MIYHGDCLTVLRTLEADSVDACVTDPPYGLEFMGVAWDTFSDRAKGTARTRNEWGDFGSREHARTSGERGRIARKKALTYQRFAEAFAVEVLRVLKPGAYILAFGAPRTYHRLASGIEDAGFEIRDGLQWLFGSGFPKSLNLGDGRGTALKPGYEPIVLGMKPTDGTFAANVAKHGTAALNIDACRIDGPPSVGGTKGGATALGLMNDDGWQGREGVIDRSMDDGRWPSNVLLDEEAAALLDASVEPSTSRIGKPRHGAAGDGWGMTFTGREYDDAGGPSRFCYVAKPSREERDFGCKGLTPRQRDESRKDGNPGGDNPRNRGLQPRGNFHPTVKPVELMRWLVRLVTPPGGLVLDPFLGSGTTGMACRYEQRRFIGIEREAEYIAIAERRIAAVAPLFSDERTA